LIREEISGIGLPRLTKRPRAVTLFIMLIVADNLNIVNRSIERAVSNRDPEPIREMIRRVVQAGAMAVDVNSGPLPRNPGKQFAFMVETACEATSLPLFLDTGNPVALEAGLAVCRNRAVINGFSLEPFKLEHILPLAEKFEVDIIGYLLRSDGHVPMAEDEMMTVAVTLFEAFVKAGLDPARLIIDPVVAPVTWDGGMGHNRGVISVIRHLPELLGVPVKTIAGLSNLASGPAAMGQKEILECAYLPMLAEAGLDMVLMNLCREKTVQIAGACGMLCGGKVFSWAEIGPT